MADDRIFRVLSLDGGGAKGFYTLGALKEIEALVGFPLCMKFNLIFGTSTGAIIAALLGLAKTVDEIEVLYLSCCRFRRHRVRCFDGAGGGSWKDGSLHASSSLRLCG